jgi:hypothetical protein
MDRRSTGLRSYVAGKAGFGLSGLVSAGFNMTRQFVGSYRVDPTIEVEQTAVIAQQFAFKGRYCVPDFSGYVIGFQTLDRR